MSKWVVDIHGDIEGDYDLIEKYDESKTDILDKIEAEIEQRCCITVGEGEPAITLYDVFQIIDKYKRESEE